MYDQIQMHCLQQISHAAEGTKRELESLRDQALHALRKMEEGKSFGGFGGPISHQTPFNLEKYAERLQGTVNMARALKIDQEHIQWAHDMGVAGQFSPYHEELWIKIRGLADEA